MRRTALTIGAAIAAALIAAPGAGATTYNVPAGNAAANPGDGICNLAEAIQAANGDGASGQCAAGTGDDTILLAPGEHTSVLQLNIGDTTAGDSTTLQGAGGGPVTIRDTGIDRMFLVQGGSDTHIDGVTITGGNLTAPGVGGAIFLQSGATLTITNSTLTGNHADSPGDGDGGAIGLTNASNARINLTNVTMTGNSASRNGGALELGGATGLSMNNVTISGNVADSDNNGGGAGGISRSAMVPVNISNSIVAGNTDRSGGGPDCGGFTGGTVTSSHNLIGDVTGCGYPVTGTGDLLGANPLLGPLASNGGTTQTMALGTGSPAIDKGAACAATDQRGVARPQGAGCDVGAFELAVPPAAKKCKKKTKRKHKGKSAASAKKKRKGCKKKKRKKGK